MNEASRQVGMLSIFYYMVAAIPVLIAIVPVLTLPLGISMLAASIFQWDSAQVGASLLFLFFGLGYFLLPASVILICLVFAGGLTAAGYFLSKKRKYTFCLVMAGVALLFLPFGTILGIFTIIVLRQPAVRALFHADELASLTPVRVS